MVSSASRTLRPTRRSLTGKAIWPSALEAAGTSGASAKAQALIHQAVKEGDQLTAYCLCSDPLKFRADSLGVNQQTLQSVYAAAQMAKVGPNPLMGIGSVPGGALIQLFPDIQTLISETSSAATTGA